VDQEPPERLHAHFSGHMVEHPIAEAVREQAVLWPLKIVAYGGIRVECGRCEVLLRSHKDVVNLEKQARFWDEMRALVIGHMITHHKYNADGTAAA
jgi:hypothetical protein